MIINLDKVACGDSTHPTPITASSNHYQKLIHLQLHKKKHIPGNWEISNKNWMSTFTGDC